jgi:DNA-binding transcriptional LysR family regulator
MNIKQLQHLVALADEGNFRRASERVHLSQPAFSRSIQAVEAELGLKLFDRGTVEATCTPAGEFVVKRARRLLQESRQLERDVRLYREREIGDIAIGAGPLPAAALVPALVVEMRRRHPRVGIRVQVNNPRYLLDYVRREEHDFFIGDTREVPRDGRFAVRQIGRLPGGFFARRDHPLLSRGTLRVADLVPYGIGTGRLPTAVRNTLLELMGLRADDPLPVAVECDDIHFLKRIALATDTVVAGSPDIFAQEIGDGTMTALPLEDFPPMYSELGIVSLEGRTPSPAAEYAIEMLRRLARREPLNPPAAA